MQNSLARTQFDLLGLVVYSSVDFTIFLGHADLCILHMKIKIKVF